MFYMFLLVSCIIFVELFIFLDLKSDAIKLITKSREAMSVVRSLKLNDDAKEQFMRQASIDMFKSTLMFAVKFLFITIILYAVYWLTIIIVPDIRAPILDSIVSPIIIIGLTIFAMSYVYMRNVVLK